MGLRAFFLKKTTMKIQNSKAINRC